MTKNFIITTIVGIFIIYGCSQKAQLAPQETSYTGETFTITDAIDQIKCTSSGGKVEQNTCFCPSKYIKDDNNLCTPENDQLANQL